MHVTSDTHKAISRYREKADIHRGVLFRSVRHGDHIQSDRLTDVSARRIIKQRAADAGVDGVISGHSLRVGSAVSLAQTGVSVADLQVAGRWKNSQMPAHHARAEMAERGAIAKYKEKQQSKRS